MPLPALRLRRRHLLKHAKMARRAMGPKGDGRVRLRTALSAPQQDHALILIEGCQRRQCGTHLSLQGCPPSTAQPVTSACRGHYGEMMAGQKLQPRCGAPVTQGAGHEWTAATTSSLINVELYQANVSLQQRMLWRTLGPSCTIFLFFAPRLTIERGQCL
jgi:hypothetical protein